MLNGSGKVLKRMCLETCPSVTLMKDTGCCGHPLAVLLVLLHGGQFAMEL